MYPHTNSYILPPYPPAIPTTNLRSSGVDSTTAAAHETEAGDSIEVAPSASSAIHSYTTSFTCIRTKARI